MEQSNSEMGDAVPSTGLEVEPFSKQVFQSLVTLTRLSHDLPRINSDYDYYNSFPGFRFFSSKMQDRIFSLIQSLSAGVNPVLSRLGGSARGGGSLPELEELFEKLVETNDAGLEQVGHLIDILNGVAPPDPPSTPSYPLVVQTDSIAPPAPLAPYSATPGPRLPQWNRLEYTDAPLNHWARGQMVRSNQIAKPQIYREGLDNFETPFVPSLRGGVKPHALGPSAPASSDHSSLDDLLSRMRTQGAERLHPYFEELQEVKYAPSLFSHSEPEDPGPLDSHSYEFIRTEERLDALVQQLKQATEIAIDLEHHDYRSYLGFTSLVQITVKERDYIVDPLQVGQSMHRLLDPFTNPAIVKVLHGADHDVQWLQRDFGLYLVGMFDTHQASVVLGLPKKSLAFLLNYCCGVKASKKFQMADWRVRPLPRLMERYAREDTHYLLYIYHRMRNELIRRSTETADMLREVLDLSRMVCLKVYTKPVFNPTGHFRVLSKSSRSMSPIQREVCRELYAWRDRTARERDESCEYVLPGSMLFQISDKMPEDKNGILACCNPIPPVLSSCIDEVAMLYQDTKRHFLATGVSRCPCPPRMERRRRISSSDTQSSAKRANVLEAAMEQSNDSVQFTPTTSHGVSIHEAIPTLKTLLISPLQDEAKRKSLVSKVLNTFQDPFRHFLMRPQDNRDSIKHDLQEPISHSSDAILEQDVIYLNPDKTKPSPHGVLTFSTLKSQKRAITPPVANVQELIGDNVESAAEPAKRTKTQDEMSNEVIFIGKMSRAERGREGGSRENGVASRGKNNRKKPFNPNKEIPKGRREKTPFKPFDYSAVPPPYQAFPPANRMHFDPRVPYRPLPPLHPRPPYHHPPHRGPWPYSRGVPSYNRFPPPQQFARHHGVPWPS